RRIRIAQNPVVILELPKTLPSALFERKPRLLFIALDKPHQVAVVRRCAGQGMHVVWHHAICVHEKSELCRKLLQPLNQPQSDAPVLPKRLSPLKTKRKKIHPPPAIILRRQTNILPLKRFKCTAGFY